MRPILTVFTLLLCLVSFTSADDGDGEYFAVRPFQQSPKGEEGGILMEDSDDAAALDERSVINVLMRRQTGRCVPASYVRCANAPSRCCPPGNLCCPATGSCCPPAFPDCTTDRTCCRSGWQRCAYGRCAPAGWQCCPGSGACPMGQSCCGSTCCKSGASCCPSGRGCCNANEVCCSDGCCPKGTQCASGRRCLRPQTLTKTSTTTSRSSTTTRATSTRKPTSTISCKNTPTIDLQGRSVVATGIPEADTGTTNNLEKRQSMSEVMKLYCETEDEEIPVMYFPLVPGLTEELIRSTCGGIGGGSEILLHWGGDGKSTERRRTAGCDGYCARRGESTNPNWGGDRNECDEFPPASSREGGDPNCHKLCIPWYQNRLGGAMLWSYASRIYKLRPNQEFIIRVIPGCEFLDVLDELETRSYDPEMEEQIKQGLAVFEDVRRRQDSSSQLSNSSSVWYEDPRIGAAEGYGWIVNGIFDAPDGQYSMEIELSKKVDQLAIIDGNGDEFMNIMDPELSGSYNITVESAKDISLLAYGKKDDDIKISYKADVVPLSASASTAASAPTATESASLATVASVNFVLVCLTAVAATFAGWL